MMDVSDAVLMCDTEKFKGGGIGGPPEIGGFCDDLVLCVARESVETIFTVIATACPMEPCENDGVTCIVDRELSAELWRDLCMVSLYPGMYSATCFVWGP